MEQLINEYLAGLKAEGRSNPIDWQGFYEFLIRKRQPASPTPPVPMILAASAESAASKHGRLGEQLRWAARNDCLDEAIEHLERIPRQRWETSSEDRWFIDSYPSC